MLQVPISLLLRVTPWTAITDTNSPFTIRGANYFNKKFQFWSHFKTGGKEALSGIWGFEQVTDLSGS